MSVNSIYKFVGWIVSKIFLSFESFLYSSGNSTVEKLIINSKFFAKLGFKFDSHHLITNLQFLIFNYLFSSFDTFMNTVSNNNIFPFNI